jgi:hypothetical protein
MKFLYQSIYALCVFGGAMLARPLGISGVAVAVLAATIVAYALMAHLSLRLTGTRWRPFVASQLPAAAICSAVAAAGVPASIGLRAAGAGALVVCVVTLAIAGVAALVAVFALPLRYQHPVVAANLAAVRSYGLKRLGVFSFRPDAGTAVSSLSIVRRLRRRVE